MTYMKSLFFDDINDLKATNPKLIIKKILSCFRYRQFNLLKTKRRLLYLNPKSVPRCKYFSSRL